MSFVYEFSAHNDTFDSSVQNSDGLNVLATAINIADGIGYLFTLLGFLFNYFCYITANHLPESTSANLMKYVAVWDTISLVKIGLLDSALRKLGLQWELHSVRYSFECEKFRVCSMCVCVSVCCVYPG